MKRGYRSPTQIADIINSDKTNPDMYVSPAVVSNDIKAIKHYYKEQQLEDYNAYRNELIEDLRQLKLTYWEGYLKSMKPKISVEMESLATEDDYELMKAEGLNVEENERVFLRNAKVREEQRPEGNHAFLQGMFQVDDKISKIYGVDAPSKVALTDPTGQQEASSPLTDILTKLESFKKPLEIQGEIDGQQEQLHGEQDSGDPTGN
jgi:hypothetical protein